MSNNSQYQPPEEYIDISSGAPVSAGQHYADGYERDESYTAPRRSKKPAIIIISVAAALLLLVGAAGFVYFQMTGEEPQEETKPTAPPVFTYAAKTVVSGVDISGKTVEQARLLLEKNTDSFITPVTFNININGNEVQLKEEDFTYTYNIDEVLEQAKADSESSQPDSTGGEGHTYKVTATVKNESIENNVKELCEEYDSDPKNAYVTEFHPYAEERFEYAEAVSGVKVDGSDLQKQITEAFRHGNAVSQITAEVDITEADTGAEALSKKLVKLVTYETYSYNTENGTSNMRVSLEKCNGSIIEPGGVWSFNERTGDSNLESNGYKSAGVILEGKLTEGIGGGICQSSTTIYNAAVRANMGIEERYNHKWASSYVPAGMDATIDYPGLDLKLSNPTDYQMFLECRVEGTTLYASFWGARPDDWDEIHAHNELSDTGEKTYTVRAWRVYYKDGQEIDREELDKSTYDLENGVVFTSADNDSRATYPDFGSSGNSANSASSAESSSSSGETAQSSQNSETEQDDAPQDEQSYYLSNEESGDLSSEQEVPYVPDE